MKAHLHHSGCMTALSMASPLRSGPFRTELKKRQSQLVAELGIMNLGGAVEPVT